MDTQPMKKGAGDRKVTAFCRSYEDLNDHDRFRDDPAASGTVAVFLV